MYVELHMLQNFAPHCLNRDDTNTPKDCEFGGYRRARISSQCLKRSARTSQVFEDTVEQEIGTRTKLLVEALKTRLQDTGHNEETAESVATAFVEAVAGSMKENKTSVLLYLGEDEISSMADSLAQNWSALQDVADDEGKLKGAVKPLADDWTPGTKAADISMFGRMVAENTNMNIDAACQVAHAISTHPVNMEMDFYTAVDDLQPDQETGAGMMGVIPFNSSCFYRYANICTNQLVENLNGDSDLANSAVEAFLRASVAALPSGKQNSMAAHNRPDLVMAVVHDGDLRSLANAFVDPVRKSRGSDVMTDSITKLDAYWGRLCKVYGDDHIKGLAVCTVPDAELENLNHGSVDSFDDLIEDVKGNLQ